VVQDQGGSSTRKKRPVTRDDDDDDNDDDKVQGREKWRVKRNAVQQSEVK
jgi:hypothetical protein